MDSEERVRDVSLLKLFFSFLRLGTAAFGGPTMVAYIREMAVNRYKWLTHEEFKNGVILCQSIPGATAIQVAGYVGLIKKGLPGAIATFMGFGLPSFLIMLILSGAYTIFGSLPSVISLFGGLQVMVVAIVANATYIFARDNLKGYRDALIAIFSSLAFFFRVSPFFVIICTAVFSNFIYKTETPSGVYSNKGKEKTFFRIIIPVIFGLFLTTSLFFLNERLFELSLLMLKVDLFAFGGGFASIPLMLQEVVNIRGLMDSKTFMDGIALGQITPGPIVITATFVGLITDGLLGATVATISIFLPSFTLLIIGKDIFGRLQKSLIFQRAKQGIFASFVGLLIFVTFKFAHAVHWDFLKVVFITSVAVALLKKIDILYVVLLGSVLSLLLF